MKPFCSRVSQYQSPRPGKWALHRNFRIHPSHSCFLDILSMESVSLPVVSESLSTQSYAPCPTCPYRLNFVRYLFTYRLLFKGRRARMKVKKEEREIYTWLVQVQKGIIKASVLHGQIARGRRSKNKSKKNRSSGAYLRLILPARSMNETQKRLIATIHPRTKARQKMPFVNVPTQFQTPRQNDGMIGPLFPWTNPLIRQRPSQQCHSTNPNSPLHPSFI